MIFPNPSNNGEQNLDIYSHLLTQKIIFLKDEITDEIANIIIAQILFLDAIF
jgi:ATP-dependent Clp protease, protease subunit